MQPEQKNYVAVKEVQQQRYEKVNEACSGAWAAGNVFYQVKNVYTDNRGLYAQQLIYPTI